MPAHNANPEHLNKCVHKTCVCLVQPGETYCSEYCEHADDKAADDPFAKTDECKCGHSGCK